ncbi:uncharacterized protein BX664DRAFT_321964 [Halteromyces radiatus]|uniref:uncharacterized protein n=1 Tax=Halteromyces radiatus TaxID=101107 RepID=UPI00221E4994|nr:uncharacterized protein BX664DRAFT_321964 [Halteromyces radiatus]KAI8099722.1 hypothetical protein BX664DRAFT_321964 [Halteromyces radiatus]
MKSLNSRTTFHNKIQKKLGHYKLSKDADILIYLNYVLFMKRLAEVTHQKAFDKHIQAKKKNAFVIRGENIREVTKDVLREFRG